MEGYFGAVGDGISDQEVVYGEEVGLNGLFSFIEGELDYIFFSREGSRGGGEGGVTYVRV